MSGLGGQNGHAVPARRLPFLTAGPKRTFARQLVRGWCGLFRPAPELYWQLEAPADTKGPSHTGASLPFRNATRSGSRVSFNENLSESPAACNAAGQSCLIIGVDVRRPSAALVAHQGLSAFLANRLEAARVKVERVEDRRRDLRGEGSVVHDPCMLDVRRRHHQRHIAIVLGPAAMFGKLAPAGADDAVIGEGDEVRHAAVVERILVEPGQFVAVE